MSILDSTEPLRRQGAFGVWITGVALRASVPVFALLRRVAPILKLGSTVIVSRYDDVIEVFGNDADFKTPYMENIEVLTGGEPFFLGMRDSEAYREDVAAMRRVFKPEDLEKLAAKAEAQSESVISTANGQLEIVSDLVREVTFELYIDYIGIPQPKLQNMDVWATRLFEYQFTGSPKNIELRAEVDVIAPALRDHIDSTIAERKKAEEISEEDVLGRCLALQAAGDAKFTDTFIRTNLLCMLVGGPPQVPMVLPHALEQILRRPDILSKARAAAQDDDNKTLWNIILEAMRFDPLAPALPRIALRDCIIAEGTKREKRISEGDTVLVGFASAMRDKQRISDPENFIAGRKDHEYIHFGHGLHTCFGRFLNQAALPSILKPLLKQPKLIRAPGSEGHLKKRKIFSESLSVRF